MPKQSHSNLGPDCDQSVTSTDNLKENSEIYRNDSANESIDHDENAKYVLRLKIRRYSSLLKNNSCDISTFASQFQESFMRKSEIETI